MAYRYSMIRFVPDPARGEFVNIGAVAGDDDAGDWELRLLQNPKRAKALDDDGRLGIALAFADKVSDHIEAIDQLPDERNEPLSTSLIERWAAEMENVVQFTPPAPVAAETAEVALDLVFSELVVDPAARRFRFQKKHRALSTTRKAYRDHHIPEESVAAKARLAAGPYEGAFDFAVFNGRVVQLVQCWSFQLPNQAELAEEVKAWAWVVHELRQAGGELHPAGRSPIEIPQGSDLEVASVYVPPAEDQDDRRAFDEAQAAFAETQVRSFTPEAADAVGQSAAERLAITA